MTNPTPPPKGAIRPPVIDVDEQTVTLAVTFDWRPQGLTMNGAEVGVVAREVYLALVERFAGSVWTQLAGLRSVLTWDPVEENVRGKRLGPAKLYSEPGDVIVVELPPLVEGWEDKVVQVMREQTLRIFADRGHAWLAETAVQSDSVAVEDLARCRQLLSDLVDVIVDFYPPDVPAPVVDTPDLATFQAPDAGV